KGEILYVDNVRDGAGAVGPGQLLVNALKGEGINVRSISVDEFPTNLVQLQAYDAVILANVPHGYGGIKDEQDRMLASYVHDMGGTTPARAASAVRSGTSRSRRKATARASPRPSRRCSWATCPASTTR